MSKAELANEISHKEFQVLMKNEEFLDYFNKFNALPAFCQLVACKKNDEVLFDPPFQREQYSFNQKGLEEWLWRRRCSYFVKTRFYVQYLLATNVIKQSLKSLCRDDIYNFEPSERVAVRDSLDWLNKKCFGRVSAFRRFLMFLRRNRDSYRLYKFWIVAERLYQYVKCKSKLSAEKMIQLKEKFFLGWGDMRFPDHVLDDAWQRFSRNFKLKKQEFYARNYGIAFTIFMQKFCLEKICTFWIPRYIFSTNFDKLNLSDDPNYQMAMRYIKGNFPETSVGNIDSMEISRSSQLLPGICLTDYDGELEIILKPMKLEKKASKKLSRLLRKRNRSRAVVGGPINLTGSQTFEMTLKQNYENSSLYSNDVPESQSSLTAAEHCKQSSSNFSTFDIKKPEEDDAEDDQTPSSERKTTDVTDDVSSGESSDSDALDAEEELKERQGNEMQRLLEERLIRFHEVLMGSSLKREIVSNSFSDELRARSSAGLQKHDLASAESMKVSGERPETHDFDVAEGRDLLKAVLQVNRSYSTPLLSHARSTQENFLGTKGSIFDANASDSNTDTSRKSLDYVAGLDETSQESLLSPKLLSRNDSLDQDFAMVTVAAKKRRSGHRTKSLKKKKVTTYTFTLSGEKPVPQTAITYTKTEKKKRKKDASKANEQEKKREEEKQKSGSQQYESYQETVFEPELTLEADLKLRSDPTMRRMIVALQTDHAAGNPFYQYLLTSDNEEMMNCLNFWQDVEKSRLDYDFGVMNFTCFINSLRSIVTNYLLPNSQYAINATENLKKTVAEIVLSTDVIEMPWELRKLQWEALEDIKQCYECYRQQDLRTFYNVVGFKPDEGTNTYARYVWISPCNARLPSIQLSTPIPTEKSDDDLKREMLARMLRAQRMVLESHLPIGRHHPPPNEYEDEAESDEEGRPKTPPPPKIIIKPLVDMKTLASMSVKEYTQPATSYTLIISKQKKSCPDSPSYYKPIKKGGVLLRRPLTVPLGFNDAINDVAHLEFFKKFLKAHRAEGGLAFYLAVESLRNTDNTKQRQQKARNIIKRYFQNPRMPATKLLHCDADVVKEIPYLDIVTTTMLMHVQSAVGKSLENEWFKRYSKTFNEAIPSKPSFEVVHRVTPVKSKRLLPTCRNRAWALFMEFIKRASLFLKYMKNPKFLKQFSDFLEKQPEEAIAKIPVSEPATAAPAAVASRQESPSYHNVETEKVKEIQQVINGQVVVLNYLKNDLLFWLETRRFVQMAEIFFTKDGCKPMHRTDEGKLLKKKAMLIVNCYIDSAILPSCRINIPQEVCENTTEAIYNGLLDRGLFHEATIFVFPLLLKFWKKFCDEHYRYRQVLPDPVKKIYGYKLTPAYVAMGIERRKKQNKDKETRRASMTGMESQPKKPTAKGDGFPDYIHMDPNSFRKLRGSPTTSSDLTSRITFSVSRGVSIIQPLKYRKYTMLKSDSPEVRFILDAIEGDNKQASSSRKGSSSPKAARKSYALTESKSIAKLPLKRTNLQRL